MPRYEKPTERHRRFALAVALGESLASAYRSQFPLAGPVAARVGGCRLAKKPAIRRLIEIHREELRLNSLERILERRMALAEKVRNGGGGFGAIVEDMKLAGEWRGSL